MRSTTTLLMVSAAAVLMFGICAPDVLAVEIFALTNNAVDDTGLSASRGNAVWQAKDPAGNDLEIFLYNKADDLVTQLTENDFDDVNPVIAGKYVAWEGWDGNDWEIYVYNSDQVTPITDNEFDDIEPNLSAPFVFWRTWDGSDWEINKAALPRLPIAAACKITPKSLNLKSKGNWVNAMLILPNDVLPSEIDTETILLQGQLSPETLLMNEKTRIIHMKFNRSELGAILQAGAQVELTLSAYLNDGTKISASSFIKVIH